MIDEKINIQEKILTLEAYPKVEDIEAKYIIKFVLSSFFGLFAFTFPIQLFNNQTLVGFLSNWIQTNYNSFLNSFIFGLIFLSTLFSTLAYVVNQDTKFGRWIYDNYKTSPLYLGTKFLALVIMTLILFDINFPIFTSEETGLNMLGVSKSIVTLAIGLSFILPFLTNSGVMEFVGIIFQNYITPLFKVPSIAAIDLITSFFGAANAEVILCREKYRKNYYSKREAAIVMCNFSMVSISFVYVVAELAGLSGYAGLIFLFSCLITIIVSMIMPRIPPLKNLPDEYNDGNKKLINTSIPDGFNRFTWGIYLGTKQAQVFRFQHVIKEGLGIMESIWMHLLPTVMAWGTVGMILTYYTNIFNILGYPIGVVLNALGVEEAFRAAPAFLTSYIDQFIPVILAMTIESPQTRFIVTMVSLVPMIYLTEVGVLILQSDVGIGFKKLTLIYIERVVLAFPLIYIVSMILF